ncbi:MAG: tRNA pseudouridine(13) synthase TruD [Myxococcota bacterium]
MASLPSLTPTPACHGVFKAEPEDFQVEEIPKITPEGAGSHCWLWIEKIGLTTPEAARRLADALGAQRREVGWAGLKDRHAKTRQWISIPAAAPEDALALELPGIRVLRAAAHPRKLKSGVAQGNRFVLRIREVAEEAHGQLETSLATLTSRGVPNYFGTQRFGRDGENLGRARAWLVDGGRAPRDRFRRKLFVSVLQSAAFNDVLAARIQGETLDRALMGDVMKKVESGGVFVSDDPLTDQKRIETWEISPTGPMFGSKMRRATSDAEALEAKVEAAHGLGPSVYRAMGRLGPGTRRPLRVKLSDVVTGWTDDTFTLSMTLPAGAYATEVLRELFKDGLIDGSRQIVCHDSRPEGNNS